MEVLIVDNNCDNTDLYALVLTGYGAEVTTANSVKQALEILSSFIFDILICEIRFAGESVYPLLQKVKFMTQTSGKTTPILVISSCHPLDLAQNLTVKVDAYLLKPISIDHLVTVVWDTVVWAKVLHPFSRDAVRARDLDLQEMQTKPEPAPQSAMLTVPLALDQAR